MGSLLGLVVETKLSTSTEMQCSRSTDSPEHMHEVCVTACSVHCVPTLLHMDTVRVHNTPNIGRGGRCHASVMVHSADLFIRGEELHVPPCMYVCVCREAVAMKLSQHLWPRD